MAVVKCALVLITNAIFITAAALICSSIINTNESATMEKLTHACEKEVHRLQYMQSHVTHHIISYVHQALHFDYTEGSINEWHMTNELSHKYGVPVESIFISLINRVAKENVTKFESQMTLLHNKTIHMAQDRKSTRLNSSHSQQSRMPSSA